MYTFQVSRRKKWNGGGEGLISIYLKESEKRGEGKKSFGKIDK